MVGNPLRSIARGRRRGSRAAVSVVSFALTASLALAGCSGSEPTAEPDEAPESQDVADGATLSGQWPLTGRPADGEAPRHPVIVVKIDNTGSSNPQVGLSKADLVVEELVEGGSTRLAVFYYSQLAKRVGPVRSMRATDIGIVEPAEAVLVASGGAPPTVRRVAAAGIKTVTEGGVGYSRDSSRMSPYNLFMDLPTLAKTLRTPAPPASYLPWGTEEDFPGGRAARTISAQFSGGHTTSWEYKRGSYVNLNSKAAEGDEFRPDTVLVLRVKVGDAGYKDPAGNPVPETRFTGTGAAMVFHGGRVVRGTWSKKGLASPVSLRSRSGNLALPPGNVWIELVPTSGGGVSFGK